MVLAAFGAVMISLVALGGGEKLEAATSLNGHVMSVQKVMHAATSGVVVDQRTDVSSLQPVTVWNTKISSAIASTDEINPFGKATNLQARPSFGTDTLPALGLQRPNKAGESKADPSARLRCGWWLRWSNYWFAVSKPAGAGWNTVYIDPEGNLYQYACSLI